MSKCPSCGAEIIFDPASQKLKCDHCNNSYDPEKLPKNQKKSIDKQSFYCTQCGAELFVFSTTAVTFCSYCGSQNILKKSTDKFNKPNYIIPFQKTMDECFLNYKKYVSEFLFSPKYYISDIVLHKFRGIYMPYGIYNLAFHGDCVNKTEIWVKYDNDYSYYDHYDLHADVDSEIKGISFDLLSNYYDEYSQSIPFDYKGALPYNENYLAGFYADSKNITPDLYLTEAKEIGSRISTHFLLEMRAYYKYNCFQPVVKYRDVEKKTGLFPVYFAAIRDKDHKHINYAVINGQTGDVSAELPVDIKKYFLFSFLLSIPVFLFINLFGFMNKIMFNSLVLFISIICMIIYAFLLKMIIDRETRNDDKGLLMDMYHDLTKKIINKIDIGPYIALPGLFNFLVIFPIYYLLISHDIYNHIIFSVLISLTIFSFVFPYVFYIFKKEDILDNVERKKIIRFYIRYSLLTFPPIVLSIYSLILQSENEYSYFLGGGIALLLILLSFIDIVRYHNQLVARPIPQLEKRGGDSDA